MNTPKTLKYLTMEKTEIKYNISQFAGLYIPITGLCKQI